MKWIRMAGIVFSVVVLACASTAFGATLEELGERVEVLEKENRQLKEQMGRTNEKVEATADAVEATASGDGKLMTNTHIGGYGELHYNNYSGEGGAGDKKAIDFHRFVLFVNHDFTDSIRFNSELEIEHSISGDDQPGEVELEQAFVDFQLNPHLNLRGGLFLLPVGILNETHEPATFYGVERNPVEKYIIPTTWWEGGAGSYGRIVPGLSYDFYVHSGLQTSAADDYAVRDGRLKVGKAPAENLAATGRIAYRGLPDLELAVSYQYQDDITQGADEAAGSAQMIAAHAVWQRGAFALKGLYARWDLDGSGPKSIGADEQVGFYIEPSYRITSNVGVFARYNQWDNQAGGGIDSQKRQWDAGINYWPHPNVVVKCDYQLQDNESGRDLNGVNLGIGYHF